MHSSLFPRVFALPASSAFNTCSPFQTGAAGTSHTTYFRSCLHLHSKYPSLTTHSEVFHNDTMTLHFLHHTVRHRSPCTPPLQSTVRRIPRPAQTRSQGATLTLVNNSGNHHRMSATLPPSASEPTTPFPFTSYPSLPHQGGRILVSLHWT